MSLAEAKLLRQKQRIEKAEAALAAPPSLSERHTTRAGKPKQWKPFDLAAERSNQIFLPEGGVPVTEVRINTFRPPPTRDSSLSRSMSSLSQRTTGTSQADMDLHDSIDHGFQLYTTRKGRRNVEQLGAYENEPEKKQTTVEGTVDLREIYKVGPHVFGNALPGVNFIAENVGLREGQVQFVQHPNGDISAQQWSSSGYQWVNIGMFSNIRKKVEGQLAADRLKGETADQTLLQHTLAYFRAVAKQREASVTGEPFGVKEIQALLPDAKPAVKASPLPKKAAPVIEPSEPTRDEPDPNPTEHEPTNASTILDRPQLAQQQPTYPYRNYSGHLYDSSKHNQYQQSAQSHVYNAQMPSRSVQTNPGYFDVNATSKLHDPFYPDSNALHQSSYFRDMYPTTYGSNQYNLPSQASAIHNPSADPYAAPRARPTGSSRFFGEAAPFVPATQQQKTEDSTAVPLNPRTVMRGSLMEIAAQAKGRSISQTTIDRLPPYEPLKAQATPQKEQTPPSSDLKRTVANPSGIVPPKETPSSAASLNGSSRLTTVAHEANLKHSTPDRQWTTRGMDGSLAINSDHIPHELNAQSLNGPYFGDLPGMPGSAGKRLPDPIGPKKTPNEELKEWYHDGNTLARQQQYYHHIKRAQHLDASLGSQSSSSPASSFTKTTPAKKGLLTQDDSMTRLLIPVLENLSSYVQGPKEKRRGYFCPWGPAPEFAIDRSENGNQSFFDGEWRAPPQRVGRDARYRAVPDMGGGLSHLRFGAFGSSDHVRPGDSGLIFSGERLAVGSVAGTPGRLGGAGLVGGLLDGRFAVGLTPSRGRF
ncbi:hypothetical protein Tdes44962_MAKER02206 [Teratosphaeria destructans]|uniref:Uncharacterized protein n=1 Tax=Teratosphaeria destructans TaxID=418781 RepID=A0A9W7W3T0_9PEZI|nr:hypothetical protein Tdes44962_MAKER02206 [Teratosphaeria destructans]